MRIQAIMVRELGGPEKLILEEIALPAPGSGQVRVRVEAAGVNFADVYNRSGLYPAALPKVLGQEVAGVVTALGPDVTAWRLGDRVATARADGGYAQEALVPSAQLVAVPSEMPLQQAAALILQGLTAHYLASSTFALRPGDTALVHAAAGGVGLLLVQIAKLRGARVIATVGTDEKAALALGHGADEVVLYRRESFSAAVRRLTNGAGVDVVYDGVGRDTFEESLDCLRPRGLLASYGNASGPVLPVAPLLLMQKGSLHLTRPTLNHYTLTRAELEGRVSELFGWVLDRRLRLHIGATFPLAEAAKAHRALEGRMTTGKILLLPWPQNQENGPDLSPNPSSYLRPAM